MGREKDWDIGTSMREEYYRLASPAQPQYWGLSPKPGHVSWPRIKPMTYWFKSECSWTTEQHQPSSNVTFWVHGCMKGFPSASVYCMRAHFPHDLSFAIKIRPAPFLSMCDLLNGVRHCLLCINHTHNSLYRNFWLICEEEQKSKRHLSKSFLSFPAFIVVLPLDLIQHQFFLNRFKNLSKESNLVFKETTFFKFIVYRFYIMFN